MTESKPAVLFLCTGNSCRSQMAEGFLRHLAGDRLDAHSAGTEPAREVHPKAVQVMAEIGVDISGQAPKGVKTFLGKMPVHALITVCDSAAKSCPTVWPGVRQRMHWSIEDPAAFRGDDDATLAKYREVRDEIGARLRRWLSEGT